MDEAGHRIVQQRPIPSLCRSMGVYFRKKEILTRQSNLCEDPHQRSVQGSPHSECFEPSVLCYLILMKTSTDVFYALKPIAHPNHWKSTAGLGFWGAFFFMLLDFFFLNKQTQQQ